MIFIVIYQLIFRLQSNEKMFSKFSVIFVLFLATIGSSLGEDKVTDADFKKVLTKGKVVIAGLINDKAVLKAMVVNEEVTTKAYEKALDHEDFSVAERVIIERHWADEKRHKQWFSDAAERQ